MSALFRHKFCSANSFSCELMEAGANLWATILMKIQMRSHGSSIFAECFDAVEPRGGGGRWGQVELADDDDGFNFS